MVARADLPPRLCRALSTSENHNQLRVLSSDPAAAKNAQALVNDRAREEKNGNPGRGPCRSSAYQVKNKYSSHKGASDGVPRQLAADAVGLGQMQAQGFTAA